MVGTARESTTSRSPSTKRPSTTASAAPERTIGRVGPAAEEQLERLYDERLAGTGLAREGRHARADDEIEIGDDPEVPDTQLDKHGRSQRSVRPKRCRNAEWKSRTPKLISRAGSGGRPADHAVAQCQLDDPGAVDDRRCGTVGDHGQPDLLAGLEHQGAVEEHVRATRA